MVIRVPTREEFTHIVDHILIPSFPATERPDSSGFMELFDNGQIFTLAAFAGQSPSGVSISFLDFRQGESSGSASDVVLISWLAVSEAGRGNGTGSGLLHETVDVLTAQHDPFLILIEVEDPRIHTEVGAYGDPAARIRFYERNGARRIDTPFAMPREDITGDVLPGMLLYSVGGRAHHTTGSHSPALGAPLTRFLRAYAQAAGEPQHPDGSFIHPDIEQMVRSAPHAAFT
ncbi:hypothetical protein JTE88_02380 [Arcanobacterium phocisimile]|uniref:N-acetyltransferase domain-containing protein n=1 Tax=Arcanobacterium phocisimile TaxID=1302235 RepID=A0ABX7IHK2_9ACTO|nr:hypothetical protein [Arcanobacterium phocisimile]QRV02613.1 hypothetical protein JTE88_02380 [Arcanobacterium phocisimile]